MFEQRLHSGNRPGVSASKLGLNYEAVSVQGRRARQAARLIFGEIGFDIFFGRRLQH